MKNELIIRKCKNCGAMVKVLTDCNFDAPLLVARGDWQVVKDAQRPVVHSVKSIYSLSKPSTKVGKRLYSFASVT